MIPADPLEALRAQALPRYRVGIDLVAEAARDLGEGRLTEALRHRAAAAAHRLRGGLDTFGVEGGSTLAAEAEAILVEPKAREAPRLAGLADRMRSLLEAFTSPPSSTRRIVALDDDPGTLAAVGAILTSRGHRFTGVPTAEEFRAALEAEPADLVILDVDLGGESGLEVLRGLRAESRHATVPVLLLSAMAGARREAFATGADDFMEKPFGPDALAERVENRLARAASRTDLRRPAAHVAIVEDDPSVARLLVYACTARGWPTTWLRDGAEACEALTGPSPRLRPGVVLLDVNLPGEDGHTVLAELARAGRLRTTRVIAVTARNGEREVLRLLEAGAFDHVAKPFSLPILMERVRRAMEG